MAPVAKRKIADVADAFCSLHYTARLLVRKAFEARDRPGRLFPFDPTTATSIRPTPKGMFYSDSAAALVAAHQVRKIRSAPGRANSNGLSYMGARAGPDRLRHRSSCFEVIESVLVSEFQVGHRSKKRSSMSDSLCYWTASEVAAAIRERRVSPVEVFRAPLL